ncbi:hypothetical protein [Sphingopyxis sp. PET50]|uniref:hypothetical protein n=1 Tax=Sphingopyxis sp. PET50 TaxID=2976533 RepID=UPI0021AE8214|nr:hypothetical protein [Sphingopyxis sp. PET50]
MRGVFGWLAALIPVAWIGYLLWHFMRVGGNSMDEVVGIGLGPTVAGLAIVGLLFLIGPLLKLIRAASGTSRVPGAGVRIDVDPPATEGFDADAALARYMAQRAEAPPALEEAPPPAPRPQFGRKVG